MTSNADVCACKKEGGRVKKVQERRVRRWKKRGKEDKQGRHGHKNDDEEDDIEKKEEQLWKKRDGPVCVACRKA